MDDARAGPSADGGIWILRLEPCNQSTWVAATYDDPVSIVAKSLVLTLDEGVNVGQGLLRREETQVLGRPIVEGL